MKIFSFRPGCATRRTVFENQLILYAKLQERHGYHFRIAVDEESHEPDDRFEWVRLKRGDWEVWRGRHWHLGHKAKVARIVKEARGSDGILTIDPVVYPQAILAFEAARILGIPVWFDATITLLTECINTRWYSQKYRLLKRLLGQAERILIPTPKVVERFKHLHLLDDSLLDRFRLLGHPVDPDHFSPNPRAEVPGRILCVSRLVPEKGIAYILEAFALVASARPDAHLQFIGSGPMEGWIKRRIHTLGLVDRVQVVAPVAHGMLPELLRSGVCSVSHPLSMPNWEEYFGVANLEAMACGLPVITSAGGGVKFALRPPFVFREVQERDISDLGVAMLEVLNEPRAPQNEMTLRNRAHLERLYSSANLAKVFDDALIR